MTIDAMLDSDLAFYRWADWFPRPGAAPSQIHYGAPFALRYGGTDYAAVTDRNVVLARVGDAPELGNKGTLRALLDYAANWHAHGTCGLRDLATWCGEPLLCCFSQ